MITFEHTLSATAMAPTKRSFSVHRSLVVPLVLCMTSVVSLGCSGETADEVEGAEAVDLLPTPGAAVTAPEPVDTESVSPEPASTEPSEVQAMPSATPPEPEPEPQLASNPLAKLTNAEYVESLRILLDIPRDSAAFAQVLDVLPSEPLENGLRNNALNQTLTQVEVSGLEQVASIAADVFLEAVTNVRGLAARLGCVELGAADVSPCIVDFGIQLMERAYRRGPSESYKTEVESLLVRLNDVIHTKGMDPVGFNYRMLKLRALITYVALSPEFMLLVERGTADLGDQPRPLRPYELGSRLSYFLTGAPPDDELLDAAASGALEDPAERIVQVDRLLGTEAGRDVFAEVFIGWLGVDPASDSDEHFAVLDTLVKDWVASDRPFRDFYQAPVEVPHADGTTSTEPFGVLGSQAFVSAHTEYPTPSFITRGVFVFENLLCGTLPSNIPEAAFQEETQTPLEVFEVHAKNPCAACHVLFDNYGAVFQQFDGENSMFDPAVATFGTSFGLAPVGDVSGEVSGLADLGAKLAESEQAANCATKLMYRHATRRSVEPGVGEAEVARLTAEWLASDTSVKSLVRSIVGTEDFARFVP